METVAAAGANAGVGVAGPAGALLARAWRCVESGRLAEAKRLSTQLTVRFPAYPAGWYAASEIALRQGDNDAARAAIQRAIDLDADEAEWRIQLARCLVRSGDICSALATAIPLVDDSRLGPGACSALASVLLNLGRGEPAISLYRRAAALRPELATHHYNLGVALRAVGRIDEAEASIGVAIRIDPEDAGAYYVRSQLRHQTPEQNHVAELQALLPRLAGHTPAIVKAHYALAKELEDLGRYDEAFMQMQRGADLRRRTLRYEVDTDLAAMLEIERVFDAEQLASRGDGDDSTAPIFVLGMPRTGSTLVDRIIGSHPSVRSAGEVGNFPREVVRLVQAIRPSGRLARSDLIRLSAGIDRRELARSYARGLHALVGDDCHFIDKLPLNFLYVGLIALALPRATIIHVRRDPIDTCYAAFKTLFADAYPYSYRLDELGRYYLGYRRLMAHWDRALPGRIHHVEYERLVADPEAESRALLEACGVQWDPRCLRFHEDRQVVATASATQVRAPVYRSSVGMWRNYAEQLQPLIRTLERDDPSRAGP